ncbi:hypothetical protein BSLG_006927 [Batrachochytrium salamandrivorans]|nr:hypothetical protein BSLG_006927 [Batrachochytrium salamandrivorans]
MMSLAALPPLPLKTPISKPSGAFSSNTPSIEIGGSHLVFDEGNEPRTYYLQVADHASVEDSDNELEYEKIPVEQFDDYSDSEVDETLDQAVRNIHEKACLDLSPVAKMEELIPTLTKHPEVIDDYIRNYLSAKGLVKSLDAFQNEWYEFQQKERLSPEDVIMVPDVYHHNQELADSLQKLRIDVDMYKDIASKARSTYDKLRKERDFHRMHHKRVVQEKNKLILDIKRLKKHYESYEPTLKQLQHKYEVAMKEKTLTKLERDRLVSKVATMKSNVEGIEKNPKNPTGGGLKTIRNSLDQNSSPSVGVVGSARSTPAPTDVHQQTHIGGKKKTNPKDATLFSEDRVNPFLSMEMKIPNYDKFKQIHQVKGHSIAISSLKFHPKKPILATVSDDRSWKMWEFPSGELIMSGEGHKDWISDCDFHPRGTQLATASGDGTVKLWDFSKGVATLTMSDHTQAVWSCAFHDQEIFLLVVLWITPPSFGIFIRNAFSSCDADGVVKFWDLRSTSEISSVNLGPHAANKISFDPSGSILAVASNSGVVRIIHMDDPSRSLDIKAYTGAVQSVVFDRTAEYMVTADSAGSYSIFQ